MLLLLFAITTHRALALIGIPRAGMNRNLVLNGGGVKLLLSPKSLMQWPLGHSRGRNLGAMISFTKVEVDRQQFIDFRQSILQYTSILPTSSLHFYVACMGKSDQYEYEKTHLHPGEPNTY